MLVICDVDGVLADFDSVFDTYIRKFLPNLCSPVPSEYDFRERYPSQDQNKLSELFNQFAVSGGFYRAKPYPGIEKVSILNPTIITSRPEVAMNDTYMWLREHNIRFNKIIMVHDKSKYVPQARLIFEDKPKNILPFAEAGVKSYMFVHPYNDKVQHKNIVRMTSWAEVDTEKIARLLNI